MSDKLDVKRYLRRVIIACWVALVVCLLFKLLGANIFEIICKNDTFIAVCNYADTHIWADYLISAIYCFVSLYFFILAILQERKFKAWQLSVVILTVLIGTGVKIWSATAGLIFDVWQVIIMPILFLGKRWKEYWKVLVANVLLVAFQAISIYIKDTSFYELYSSNLFSTIYSIDVLIMLILSCCYSNIVKIKKEIKKENKNNE